MKPIRLSRHGIEILDAIRRLGDPSVLRQIILEGVDPG